MVPQEAFEARGIVPSNYARYHVQALHHALDDAYGVMPHITCDDKGELAEVRQRAKAGVCGTAPKGRTLAGVCVVKVLRPARLVCLVSRDLSHRQGQLGSL